jgi:hypothetical protein
MISSYHALAPTHTGGGGARSPRYAYSVLKEVLIRFCTTGGKGQEIRDKSKRQSNKKARDESEMIMGRRHEARENR